MNPLRSFIARVQANKVMTTTGLALGGCAAILKWPSLTAWLPEDIGKTVWNFAHDYFLFFIAGAFAFVKQHGSVGDPEKAAPAPSAPTAIGVQPVIKPA